MDSSEPVYSAEAQILRTCRNVLPVPIRASTFAVLENVVEAYLARLQHLSAHPHIPQELFPPTLLSITYLTRDKSQDNLSGNILGLIRGKKDYSLKELKKSSSLYQQESGKYS